MTGQHRGDTVHYQGQLLLKDRMTSVFTGLFITISLIVATRLTSVSYARSRVATDSGFYTLTQQDIERLYQMALDGLGDAAILEVADEALTTGSWTAAPGDEIAFDPYMPLDARGAVIDYDDIPAVCAATHGELLAPDPDQCVTEWQEIEAQVRFGLSMFSTPTDHGHAIRTPDDVLATYIEEVGHSWQEYLFETQGRVGGDRIRKTRMSDTLHWCAGREYQIKMYILQLDGEYLNLSDEQRNVTVQHLCRSDGYANPVGKEVPAYGPPPGWPQPEGWPLDTPTTEEHRAFCNGLYS